MVDGESLFTGTFSFVRVGGGGRGSHIVYTSSPIKDQVPLDRTAASLLSALELCTILTTEFTVD